MQNKLYKLEAMKFIAGKTKEDLKEIKDLAADVFDLDD